MLDSLGQNRLIPKVYLTFLGAIPVVVDETTEKVFQLTTSSSVGKKKHCTIVIFNFLNSLVFLIVYTVNKHSVLRRQSRDTCTN